MRYVVCQGTSNRKVLGTKTKYKAIGLYSGAGLFANDICGASIREGLFPGGLLIGILQLIVHQRALQKNEKYRHLDKRSPKNVNYSKSSPVYQPKERLFRY